MASKHAAVRVKGNVFQHTHIEFALDDKTKKVVIDQIKKHGKLRLTVSGMDLRKNVIPEAVLLVGPCDVIGPCD